MGYWIEDGKTYIKGWKWGHRGGGSTFICPNCLCRGLAAQMVDECPKCNFDTQLVAYGHRHKGLPRKKASMKAWKKELARAYRHSDEKVPRVRRIWGSLRPVTKVKPSGKIYSRKRNNIDSTPNDN